MSRHDPAHTHDLVGARLRARGITGRASFAHKCAPTQAVSSQRISTVGARSRAMGITGKASIAPSHVPTHTIRSRA
ncbi:citrate lyase beta subunit [Xanthomonas arboricola]|nr:citrate lyase beta subunit [Xanthomonas campestris]MCW2009329.1 citrate lyase beta subunit [Xanthomonas campestris]